MGTKHNGDKHNTPPHTQPPQPHQPQQNHPNHPTHQHTPHTTKQSTTKSKTTHTPPLTPPQPPNTPPHGGLMGGLGAGRWGWGGGAIRAAWYRPGLPGEHGRPLATGAMIHPLRPEVPKAAKRTGQERVGGSREHTAKTSRVEKSWDRHGGFTCKVHSRRHVVIVPDRARGVPLHSCRATQA